MNNLLDVRGVTVNFGGVTALSNVSFHVETGEFLSLIGPNGAGKTTMLRAITGVVAPQKAEIRLAGKDIAGLPTILDSFVQNDVDLVLAISTPATQAAISRIKDRPVIFATVSNPFVIDAGTDDQQHLPNVTGVYGSVPMDQFLRMSRSCTHM